MYLRKAYSASRYVLLERRMRELAELDLEDYIVDEEIKKDFFRKLIDDDLMVLKKVRVRNRKSGEIPFNSCYCSCTNITQALILIRREMNGYLNRHRKKFEGGLAAGKLEGMVLGEQGELVFGKFFNFGGSVMDTTSAYGRAQDVFREIGRRR